MIRAFNKTEIPKPIWDKELPSNFQNLDIEIGCGVGFHPIFYARNNPDRLLVAIEKTSEKFAKFERRYVNHHSPFNLVPVHANAVAWITHYVKPLSVDKYFILYPNPYPKDPQKRFFVMPFMTHLLETLKVGGHITLATNELFYAEEARKFASEYWKLEILEDSIVPISQQPRTHFEKKYLERGDICYNLIFAKG